MSNKSLVLTLLALVFSAGVVMANTTVQQIQSPIYTDDIGRSHFLGRGGYSSVRHIDMGAAQADAINEVSRDMQKAEKEIKDSINTAKAEVENTINTVETDITNVIKERPTVPVSSKTKASFTAEDRKMDASASFGRGATYLPSSGVNESKTMYTDDLGRLHFFGKGNLIKE